MQEKVIILGVFINQMTTLRFSFNSQTVDFEASRQWCGFMFEAWCFMVFQVILHKVRSADFAGVVSDGDAYMAIDVQLGGATARFILDTGASNTVMREMEARRLNARWMQVPVTAQGGTGIQSGLSLADLGEVTIGQVPCGRLQAVTTPGALPCPPDCCGILGLDVLSRLAMRLDFQRSRMKVTKEFGDANSAAAALAVKDLKPIPLQSVPGTSGLLALPLRLRAPNRGNQVAQLDQTDLFCAEVGFPLYITIILARALKRSNVKDQFPIFRNPRPSVRSSAWVSWTWARPLLFAA